MWDIISQAVIENLTNVAIGVGIFILAYLSNMCFGIWNNVWNLGQKFEWQKILKSFAKIVIVGIGIALLTISVTLIVPFATQNGLPIPQEYEEVIQIAATLIICLIASLKYIKEAWSKMYNILNHMDVIQNSIENKTE